MISSVSFVCAPLALLLHIIYFWICPLISSPSLALLPLSPCFSPPSLLLSLLPPLLSLYFSHLCFPLIPLLLSFLPSSLSPSSPLLSPLCFPLLLLFLSFPFSRRSEDRVRNGAKKLEKCRQGSTQGRLDAFFKPAPSPMTAAKRKVSVVQVRCPLSALILVSHSRPDLCTS